MDKELMEKLEELTNKIIDIMGDKHKKVHDMFEEALNQPCKISIEKEQESGGAKTCITGSRLSILITLAGLEKGILNELGCDNDEFEFIKKAVGVKEAEDNE